MLVDPKTLRVEDIATLAQACEAERAVRTAIQAINAQQRAAQVAREAAGSYDQRWAVRAGRARIHLVILLDAVVEKRLTLQRAAGQHTFFSNVFYKICKERLPAEVMADLTAAAREEHAKVIAREASAS